MVPIARFMIVNSYIYNANRAVNSENGKINEVKNQMTGGFSSVPDTARQYKVLFLYLKFMIF